MSPVPRRAVSPAPRGATSPHRVAVLVFDELAPFELGVVSEVFALPRPELEVPWWYALDVCTDAPGELRSLGGIRIRVDRGLDSLAKADTVIVPASPDVRGDPAPAVIAALREASERGARMVSICSGAFVLAATGILDGRRVATHWRYAELLARRFPRVEVDAEVLFVDDGPVITSAGTAAGIDLCLHIVRRDHGADVASRVARRMVVAPHREGGQAQFVERPVAPLHAGDLIGRAAEWALARLDRPISVAELAAHSYVSPRTFTRRFTASMGVSPGRWLLDQRIQASLPLLEVGDEPVEQIGARVGIGTPAAFRRHFARRMGVSPSAYRRGFRTWT